MSMSSISGESKFKRYFTAALLMHKTNKTGDKHLLELEVLTKLDVGDILVFWIDPKDILVNTVARGKMEWQPTTTS